MNDHIMHKGLILGIINYISGKRVRKAGLLLFLLSVSLLARGQAGKVIITDSKSGKPVSMATVCFQEIDVVKTHCLTSDSKGEAVNPSSGNSVVVVSYMGYKTYIDTVAKEQVVNINLVPDVFDIDQAVVTASFVPQKADNSIYRINVIDRAEIDQKAAANVGDVLANDVNIRLSHDPALGTSMRLKGLSGNNIKILVDGVPVIGRMGGNIDLGQLNLYNIDHIEMVEGPMSVVYGSNALAGAINIITKENKYTSFSSSVNSYLETRGTYNFDGRVAIKKNKHSLSLSGARNFFGGYSLDTLRSQEWKPKEQYNADFYYTWSPGNSKIKYQSSLMKERLWDKGNLMPPLYFKATDAWFKSLRFNNRIEYELKKNSGFTYNMVFSHSLYNRNSETWAVDLSDLTSVLSGSELTGFNAFNYRLLTGNQDPSRRLSFLAGLDLNYEIGSGERIYQGKQEIGDYAIFTSFLINPGEKLSLQPGVRFAYNTRFNVPPVPSINIKLQPASFLGIRASYARGYRAPTLKELYIFFVDINHNIKPNEDLKAEYGNNFDLSFTLNTDREEKTHITKLDASFFYNNMHNIIVLAEIDKQSILYQYVNILDYNTMGGEASFKYSYYPIFDMELGIGTTGTYYSLTKKRQTLDDYIFSPDINLNVSSTIPSLDLNVALYYKYTGKSWYFSLAEDESIDVSVMDSYNNMDLTFSRKFIQNRLALSCGVKNLFNNTVVRTTGQASEAVHSSAEGSLVGYGRVYFFKAAYNIFR